MTSNTLDDLMSQLGDDAVDLSGQPQTPRDFIADTMRRMMTVDAGTEDSEVVDPNAPVDDGVIDILDKAMFALAPGLAALDTDDDTRVRDAAKTAAASRTLDEIMEGFEAATESLTVSESTAEILQEIKLRTDMDYQISKLEEVRRSIIENNGVDYQTYQTLSNIGLGIETSLPPAYTYTQEPSFNGMTATLESVTRVQAAAGAVAALLGIGIIYKIYKWMKKKFGKGVEDRTANVDAAIAKTNDVLKKHEETVAFLSKMVDIAPVQDKFETLQKYVDKETDARTLSKADAAIIVKFLTTQAIDSVEGDVVDIATPEGLKQMKERKQALIEGTREIQVVLKKLNSEITHAIGSDRLPQSSTRSGRSSASIFSKVFAFSSKSGNKTVPEGTTPETLVKGAEEVQAILGDSEFKKLDKAIDAILKSTHQLHQRLGDGKSKLTDRQYAVFNADIVGLKALARDIQINHTYLVRVQVNAGKEMVKLIKNSERTQKFLKEFSSDSK